MTRITGWITGFNPDDYALCKRDFRLVSGKLGCVCPFNCWGLSWKPFHTVHGVLKARILKWFAIPFSSGPHSVRPLHHDPPVLGCPAGRMKGWSQSKNKTQLWMWLVIEARSDAIKSNIARNLECQVHESRQIGSGHTGEWQEWTSTF